jgi:hypothetical protein
VPLFVVPFHEHHFYFATENVKGGNMTTKKLTRGINREFAAEFKKNKLFALYEEHKDELFIGVRNDYLNVYYNCDSIAKAEYKQGEISCIIDRYYLNGQHYKSGNKMKNKRVEPDEICTKYGTIKLNAGNKKSTDEKKAQARLVILNNANEKSNWFCLDVEWKKAKAGKDFNGRFDIIAISKETPHKVALIELKYGNKAIGGKSGIYKHIADFSKYQGNGYFDAEENSHKKEIADIIESYKRLGVNIPKELQNVTPDNIIAEPEFYVIILDNNSKTLQGSTPKQSMSGYLFNDKRWGCKRLSTKPRVQTTFGDVSNTTNKPKVTFLFSTQTLGNLNIDDIIDGNYDERILPT